MIETGRLVLRPPTDRDRDAIAAINGDPRVGEWLAGPMDRAGSDAFVDRMLAHQAEHGFSFWAVEAKATGEVAGLAGLATMGADLPPGPCVEVGWRFSPASWGHGYASEAGRAALDWGFANRGWPEIIAITATINLRSQAVMRRIGMAPDPARDFEHPKLAADHPLRRHVLFSATRP
ncbi:MAG: GNAT family N-acetyltransferase [Proteobacteria bacterium]|nr:GNAT family N-acetyltransferase [Pseudomonadota bacterium]